MDVTSIITCLLIEVLSFANGPDLPEKSNLNLTGNTEEKEEIGKQLPRETVSHPPTMGNSYRTDMLCVFIF